MLDDVLVKEVPIEEAVRDLAKVWVQDSCVGSLCHGANLNVPGVVKFNDFLEGDKIAVMSLKGELGGLGDAKMGFKELNEKEKGLVVDMKKVFMGCGVC